MTHGKIHAIAKTFINGNISDARRALKRMSKRDLYYFLEALRGYHETHAGGMLNAYYQVMKDLEVLTR
jgi:hypothetical protein